MDFSRPGHPSQLQRRWEALSCPYCAHQVWRIDYTLKAWSQDNNLGDRYIMCITASLYLPEFKQPAALSSAQEIPGNHYITSSWENLLLVSYLSLQPHCMHLQSLLWLSQSHAWPIRVIQALEQSFLLIGYLSISLHSIQPTLQGRTSLYIQIPCVVEGPGHPFV